MEDFLLNKGKVPVPEVWTGSDCLEFDNIWDKLMSNAQLTPEEEVRFKLLFTKKHKYETANNIGLSVNYLEQAITLVDDLKADGAKLNTHDAAQMITLLYSAQDKMVNRFSLIKKAGRISQGASFAQQTNVK